jgi:hypothetical protein
MFSREIVMRELSELKEVLEARSEARSVDAKAKPRVITNTAGQVMVISLMNNGAQVVPGQVGENAKSDEASEPQKLVVLQLQPGETYNAAQGQQRNTLCVAIKG